MSQRKTYFEKSQARIDALIFSAWPPLISPVRSRPACCQRRSLLIYFCSPAYSSSASPRSSAASRSIFSPIFLLELFINPRILKNS